MPKVWQTQTHLKNVLRQLTAAVILWEKWGDSIWCWSWSRLWMLLIFAPWRNNIFRQDFITVTQLVIQSIPGHSTCKMAPLVHLHGIQKQATGWDRLERPLYWYHKFALSFRPLVYRVKAIHPIVSTCSMAVYAKYLCELCVHKHIMHTSIIHVCAQGVHVTTRNLQEGIKTLLSCTIASFLGCLPLCFLDYIHDLWTTRRSRRRPGITSMSPNRKVDSIMT